MRRLVTACALAMGLFFSNAHASEGGPDVIAGHVLTGAIPLAGFAVAYFSDDDEGEKQWLRNTVANQLIISIMRLGFSFTSLGERPSGNSYGFPSGHVGFASSGASFLEERYGWQYGVPAWLGVGYVSYVRVDNGHHYWWDVAASAVISYGIGKLFVTPRNATHIAPVIGPEAIGLRLERSW